MAQRLVIEWTRATLRLALAEGTGGKCRLRALHAEPRGSAGETAQVLSAAVKKLNARNAKVVAVIPRDQVIFRLIKLPTVQRDELAQMVELSGKAQLPYPRDEVVLDYQLLDQREGFSTIAVVACRREAIERQLAPLRAASLSVEQVTVSSWGVAGWAVSALREAKVPEPVLVINRDEERTDLVLMRGGRLLHSRSVGPGARDLPSESEGFAVLAQELDRSLATVKKELPGTEVRAFLLTGVGSLEPWREQLAQRFPVPVKVVDPAQPLAVGVSLGGLPVSPVVVGGVALADPQQLINLNPPEFVSHVRHQRQVRDVTVLGLLLLGVLGLGVAMAALQVWRQQRTAAQLAQAIAQLEPTTRHVKAKMQAVQLVSGVLSRRRHVAALLSGIFGGTPQAVRIGGLTFERVKGQVLLRGQAPSTQAVLAYLETLETVEGVTATRLKHSTRRITPSGEQTDFEIVIHANGDNAL